MYILINGTIEFVCWLILGLPTCIIKGIVIWIKDCPISETIRQFKIWLKEIPLERKIRRRIMESYKKHGAETAEKEFWFQVFIHRRELEDMDRRRNEI